MIVRVDAVMISKIIFENIENMHNLALACVGNAQKNSAPKLMGIFKLKPTRKQ